MIFSSIPALSLRLKKTCTGGSGAQRYLAQQAIVKGLDWPRTWPEARVREPVSGSLSCILEVRPLEGRPDR